MSTAPKTVAGGAASLGLGNKPFVFTKHRKRFKKVRVCVRAGAGGVGGVVGVGGLKYDFCIVLYTLMYKCTQSSGQSLACSCETPGPVQMTAPPSGPPKSLTVY